MQKSIRTFAVAAVLALTVSPAMHAERMGTNPRPQDIGAKSVSLTVFAYTILSSLGLA